MNPTREEALFALALEKPASERAAFLRACAEIPVGRSHRRKEVDFCGGNARPFRLLTSAATISAHALRLLCGADEALRQHLEALLGAHDETDNLLLTQIEVDQPAIKPDFVDHRFDEAVGQTLGRYRLLQKLGAEKRRLDKQFLTPSSNQ